MKSMENSALKFRIKPHTVTSHKAESFPFIDKYLLHNSETKPYVSDYSSILKTPTRHTKNRKVSFAAPALLKPKLNVPPDRIEVKVTRSRTQPLLSRRPSRVPSKATDGQAVLRTASKPAASYSSVSPPRGSSSALKAAQGHPRQGKKRLPALQISLAEISLGTSLSIIPKHKTDNVLGSGHRVLPPSELRSPTTTSLFQKISRSGTKKP